MPRILGVDIPNNKRLIISLTYIYGIGRTLSEKIIGQLSLNPDMKAQELSQEEIGKINALLQQSYTVEGDLRRQVQNDIKRLISIHSYRGLRHRLSLPCRGQRTKTNARTRKGKKRTVANKKMATKK